MENLKRKFKQNEWSLVQDILKNGKTGTWLDYAIKHNIKLVGTTNEQQKKAANDIWRKYLKFSAGTTTQEKRMPKILIYDIEISRVEAGMWWSGKQYVNGSQLITESKIISVAYKWFGEDEIHVLKWDKKQSDKKLLVKFLEEYNKADMVVGFNNNTFDNKTLNARALKHNLPINTYVKSLDLMREAKRLFRLPSYSLNYIAKYLQVQTKLQHSGLQMWEDIQYGSKKEAKKTMKLMLKYNRQDIVVTEEVLLKLIKYIKLPVHIGVLLGQDKATCPVCGTSNIKLLKTQVNSTGNIERIMQCKEDGHIFKLTNKQYLNGRN